MTNKTLKRAIELKNNLDQCKELEPLILFKTIKQLGIHRHTNSMHRSYMCNLGHSDIGKRLIKAAQYALQKEFELIQREFEEELKAL